MSHSSNPKCVVRASDHIASSYPPPPPLPACSLAPALVPDVRAVDVAGSTQAGRRSRELGLRVIELAMVPAGLQYSNYPSKCDSILPIEQFHLSRLSHFFPGTLYYLRVVLGVPVEQLYLDTFLVQFRHVA